MENQNKSETIALFLSAIFMLLLIIYSYLMAPKKYFIDDSCIIISRPIKSVKIDIDSINDIIPIPNQDSISFIRTFGVGGLFGLIGKYYHKKYKTVNFYANRKTGLVLLDTNKSNIIITPVDLNFVEVVKNKIKKII